MGARQASHLTIGSTAHWPILAKRRPVRVRRPPALRP